MIAVCLKWVERRPHVDPLTGAVSGDARTRGASDADLAALEHALRLGDRLGHEVLAVTAGPPAAEAVLREAVAAGARRARRVDVAADAPSDVVAEGLATAVAGAAIVLCGAWSVDRGSGSVPAFVAAHLGAAQALGLLGLSVDDDDHVVAERRLDGGRRERLRARPPVVVSVEAGPPLRRAGVDAVLAAKRAPIETAPGPNARVVSGSVTVGPYRPRPRILSAPSSTLPARERTLLLSGALSQRPPAQRIVAEPAEAAERILDQLRAWGYLAP